MSAATSIRLSLAAAFLVASVSAASAENATTVHVSLWDHGADSAMEAGDNPMMGLNMGGDISHRTMGMTADRAEAPAGDVTFIATNDSDNAIHEMVVVPLADPNAQLPYDTELMEVDEDAAGATGEVSELDAGATGSVTLHMQPGLYVLICNIPGHYAMGMWTLFTVTP